MTHARIGLVDQVLPHENVMAVHEDGFAEALITSRQNISPKRLVEPGPSAGQIGQIFRAAAAAPDHGLLTPWRFVIIPAHKRADLADVFAKALVERDPGATLAQIETARKSLPGALADAGCRTARAMRTRDSGP
jgi:nitroreductase